MILTKQMSLIELRGFCIQIEMKKGWISNGQGDNKYIM